MVNPLSRRSNEMGLSLSTPKSAKDATTSAASATAASQGSKEEHVSLAHVASDAVATPLSHRMTAVPRGKKIGIGGSISAGKTTGGRALQLACERLQVPCHFSPEMVNNGALQLYIAGQKLPEWCRLEIDQTDAKAAFLRYNRAFYDTSKPLGAPDGASLVEWAEEDNNPFANSFQILMLADCQHRVREAALFLSFQKNGLAIVDRTAWDNTVFEEANRFLYRSISDDEHRFYELVSGSAPAFGVDAMLYLDVSVDETLKRIAVRGSSAEAKYQRVYMTYLHDIWFHRVVQNFTMTPHYSLFDCSLKSGKDAPFPIVIVPWDNFDANLMENALTKLCRGGGGQEGQGMKEPRVYFAKEEEEGEAEKGDGDFVALHWTRDYALQTDDAKRTEFKRRVMQLLSADKTIKFFY